MARSWLAPLGVLSWFLILGQARLAHACSPEQLLVLGGQGIASASGGGDFNGDGFTDIVTGSDGVGRAHVYFGGPSADTTPDVNFLGAVGERFGHSVAFAGDMNGDGYDDIAVGARRFVVGQWETGRAYVFFGGAVPNSAPDLVLLGTETTWFGPVASAGDLNGDGYGDLAVSSLSRSGVVGVDYAGKVFVFLGSAAPDSLPDLVLRGIAPDVGFGESIAAGDANRDGFSDLLVAAPGNSLRGPGTGRAYLYLGGATPDTTRDLELSGSAAGDRLGEAVSFAGDVNGDGYNDFIASTRGTAGAGRALLFLGGAVVDTVSDDSFVGEAAGDRLGYGNAGAGDVNGDGYADFVLGAAANDRGSFDGGSVYVHFGGITDLSWDLVVSGAVIDGHFGSLVQPAGDFDGDGLDDFIVGSFWSAGTVHVYSGGCPYPLSADPLPLRDVLGFAVASDAPHGRVKIQLDIQESSRVTLVVCDLAGRRIATPLDREQVPAGRHDLFWRPQDLRSGLYYVSATVGGRRLTRKLVWLR